MDLIATAKFPYGRRSLVAGDKFTASDEDARILKGVGKARDVPTTRTGPAPAPTVAQPQAGGADQPSAGSAAPSSQAGDATQDDDLVALRAEYQRVKGEAPDGRWTARRLRSEIAAVSQKPGEYSRRDMRAAD